MKLQINYLRVIPISNGLVQSLYEKREHLGTIEVEELRTLLIEKFKKRLLPFEERSSIFLTTILDLRFKKEGFRSHFKAEQAVSLLEKTISCLPHTNKEPILTTEHPEPLKPKSLLLNFVKKKY